MSKGAGQRVLSLIPEIQEDLPYSPDLLGKLFDQTNADNYASLQEIAQTISLDQGLTAKILKIANSAFYGLQAVVSNAERAVLMLGLKEIRTMVLALSVNALTKRLKTSRVLDLEAYWRHQLLTACCAKALAKGLNFPPEDMFTCGMLHDLGYLITAIYMPEDYRIVQELCVDRNLTMAEAEMKHFGLDHGVIGAIVLSSWDLPPSITEPINWHHAPHMAPDYEKESAALNASDAMSHMFEDPEYRTGNHWRKFMHYYGINENSLLLLLKNLSDDRGTKEVLKVLNI